MSESHNYCLHNLTMHVYASICEVVGCMLSHLWTWQGVPEWGQCSWAQPTVYFLKHGHMCQRSERGGSDHLAMQQPCKMHAQYVWHVLKHQANGLNSCENGCNGCKVLQLHAWEEWERAIWSSVHATTMSEDVAVCKKTNAGQRWVVLGQPLVILSIGLLGGKAMGILPICPLPRPDGGSQTNHLPTDWHQETR